MRQNVLINPKSLRRRRDSEEFDRHTPTLSLIAHLMLLISLESYKLAPDPPPHPKGLHYAHLRQF
jgi:hypothetical protein